MGLFLTSKSYLPVLEDGQDLQHYQDLYKYRKKIAVELKKLLNYDDIAICICNGPSVFLQSPQEFYEKWWDFAKDELLLVESYGYVMLLYRREELRGTVVIGEWPEGFDFRKSPGWSPRNYRNSWIDLNQDNQSAYNHANFIPCTDDKHRLNRIYEIYNDLSQS